MKNYYEILEVNQNASQEILTKAYETLKNKYKPELYVGEEKQIVTRSLNEIEEAYRILSDTFLREQYDQELQKQLAGEKKKYYDKIYQKTEETENNQNYEGSQNYQDYQNRQYNQDYQNKRNGRPLKENKPHKVGSFMSMIDLTKEIFKKREYKKEKKKLVREDFIAIGLTAVIIIVLGVILWFIPFTRGFIRSLIPF